MPVAAVATRRRERRVFPSAGRRVRRSGRRGAFQPRPSLVRPVAESLLTSWIWPAWYTSWAALPYASVSTRWRLPEERPKVPVAVSRDRLAKPPVLLVQQGEIRAPRSFGSGASGRANQLLPFVGERPALLSGQAAPVGVLPVRDVHRKLPDVVAIAPGRQAAPRPRRAAQRPPQVRAVPGLPLVRLIDDPEKERELGRSLRLIGQRAARRPRTRRTAASFGNALLGGRPPAFGGQSPATADGTREQEKEHEKQDGQIAQSEPMSRRFTDFHSGPYEVSSVAAIDDANDLRPRPARRSSRSRCAPALKKTVSVSGRSSCLARRSAGQRGGPLRASRRSSRTARVVAPA